MAKIKKENLTRKEDVLINTVKKAEKKKKARKRQKGLLKVLKEKKLAVLDLPTLSMAQQDNVRQSVFSGSLSSVTNTEVDSSLVKISKSRKLEEQSQEVENVLQLGEGSKENIFSDFLESVKFFEIGDQKVLAICKHPDVLYFYGVLKISIVYGSAEILGYKFTDRTSPLNVFSLKDSGLLQVVIQSNVQSSKDFRALKEKIDERCYFLLKDDIIDSIVASMDPSSVLVLLEKSQDTRKMEVFLNNHCKTIFPSKVSICEKLRALDHPENVKKIEKELVCQFLHPSEAEKFFSVSPEWQPLVDKSAEPISSSLGNVTLLAGGKGVGKSTLLRYLINRCLSRPTCKKVLLIDLDPGQCELTLPGCLSVHLMNKPLLGPNFSHLNHSGRVWFLGDVNVVQCFDGYLECLKRVLNYCASNVEFNNIPWFINSMGFCKGLGVELMSCIIHYLRPTHVVQIQSKRDNNNYPTFLTPDSVSRYRRFIQASISRVPGNLNYTLSIVASVSKMNPNASNPPERRGAVILSYLSEILPKSMGALTDAVPFVTDVAKLKIVVCHGRNLDRAQSLAAINGNLVALCESEANDSVFDHKCLGFGIVRGIDFSDGRIFILTPLLQGLKEVNCLMMGNIFLPPSVYLQSHSSGHVPYVNVGEGQITSKITKRAFKPASTASFQDRFPNFKIVPQ